MRERPRGRSEDEYGCVMIGGGIALEPEYPEVIAWDKEYADECDRLSEIEANKTHKRRWGRWYLKTSGGLVSLDTKVCHPEQGDHPAWQSGDYDIVLNRCKTEAERRIWLEQMRKKTWIGEKGLQDLERALKRAKAIFRDN